MFARRIISSGIQTAIARPVLSQAQVIAGKQFSLTSTCVRAMSCHSGNNDQSKIRYPSPSVGIYHPAPTFSAPAVVGGKIQDLSLDSYRGKYVVLFFYPKDFTYVCPTEIIAFNDRAKEFEALNTQLIAVSTDTEESHLAWTKVPRNDGGLGSMQIPLVADTTKKISADYGVLVPSEGIALRGLFIIDPEGVVQQITVNNFPIGRSVDETLRLIQALQFHAQHGEVCPANWVPGEPSIKAAPEASKEYFSAVFEELPNKVHQIATPQELNDFINTKSKVVVSFSASHCSKCAMIAPYVNELAHEFPDVTFVKVVGTDAALTHLPQQHEVAHYPGFLFFTNGKKKGSPVYGYKKRELKNAVLEL
eukprot:c18301_g1_i2.p1 GENE.c18301_g1_i2~~c18301_g1_i2.p1  ORF type:complete len:371 (+),score=184.03 c18301_g1_i2:27-1115(+)